VDAGILQGAECGAHARLEQRFGPGAVSAWVELSKKFGKLPFEKLFEPAIEYAANGSRFLPSSPSAGTRRWRSCATSPASRSFPARRPRPARGEIFRFPDQARTLEKIAATKGEAFYRGDLAEKIEAHAKANGGRHEARRPRRTRERLAGHDQPDYRGLTVHEIPPKHPGHRVA